MTSEEVKYSLDREKPKHATGPNRLVNQLQGIMEVFPIYDNMKKKGYRRFLQNSGRTLHRKEIKRVGFVSNLLHEQLLSEKKSCYKFH